MGFGEAIQIAVDGGCIQRKGWNGKDMWVYAAIFPQHDPVMVMHTAQGTEQPGWLASQADMFATDWQEVVDA